MITDKFVTVYNQIKIINQATNGIIYLVCNVSVNIPQWKRVKTIA